MDEHSLEDKLPVPHTLAEARQAYREAEAVFDKARAEFDLEFNELHEGRGNVDYLDVLNNNENEARKKLETARSEFLARQRLDTLGNQGSLAAEIFHSIRSRTMTGTAGSLALSFTLLQINDVRGEGALRWAWGVLGIGLLAGFFSYLVEWGSLGVGRYYLKKEDEHHWLGKLALGSRGLTGLSLVLLVWGIFQLIRVGRFNLLPPFFSQ